MKHITARTIAVALLVPAVAGLFVSFYCLPPIQEMPPFDLGHEESNWVGQGGWAFAGYAVLLLVMATCYQTHYPDPLCNTMDCRLLLLSVRDAFAALHLVPV